MTFWRLLRSIVLVALCSQPITLAIVGLGQTLVTGSIDGLFAVFATPMTLAFFGLPALAWSLVVIVPTYYGLDRLGHRGKVAPAVFAIGVAILAYLFVAQPAPSGAIPGYDQAAEGFIAASLLCWAIYAWPRLGR